MPCDTASLDAWLLDSTSNPTLPALRLPVLRQLAKYLFAEANRYTYLPRRRDTSQFLDGASHVLMFTVCCGRYVLTGNDCEQSTCGYESADDRQGNGGAA